VKSDDMEFLKIPCDEPGALLSYHFLLLHDRLGRVKQNVTAEAMLLDFPRVALPLNVCALTPPVRTQLSRVGCQYQSCEGDLLCRLKMVAGKANATINRILLIQFWPALF
jgi:hypothetical protein